MENTKPYGFVYIIANQVNGKVYVGQTQDPTRRWLQHRNAAIKRVKKPLYRSINKHGIENFFYRVLASAKDKQLLDYAERFFILLYSSSDLSFGYNLDSGGQKNKRLTPSVIENMRKPKSEEHLEKLKANIVKARKAQKEAGLVLPRNKITGRFMGKGTEKEFLLQGFSEQDTEKMRRPKTEKHRLACSAWQKGRKLTEKHRQNISKALAGRKASEEWTIKMRGRPRDEKGRLVSVNK